jgi:ABC-2 type transport system permease protein
MITIFKKELKVYFSSLLGYVLMFVFLLLAGTFFWGYFLAGAQASSDFSAFFADINTALLFIIPILTFRTLVEDKKLGTYELLLTSPVTAWDIVLGKFLAAFAFVMLAATLVLIFPLAISFITTVEWGAVLAGWLGIFFSAAFFIAIGMFASSLTDNYVIAGLIALMLSVLMLVLSFFGNSQNPQLSAFFQSISYASHYQQFAQGLIRAKDFLYFAIGIFLWLFLAKSIVESRTWK